MKIAGTHAVVLVHIGQRNEGKVHGPRYLNPIATDSIADPKLEQGESI